MRTPSNARARTLRCHGQFLVPKPRRKRPSSAPFSSTNQRFLFLHPCFQPWTNQAFQKVISQAATAEGDGEAPRRRSCIKAGCSPLLFPRAHCIEQLVGITALPFSCRFQIPPSFSDLEKIIASYTCSASPLYHLQAISEQILPETDIGIYTNPPVMEAAINSKARRFFSVLLAAVSEWSLIFVLMTNAVLAYVATRLARVCKLPPPCLLCSRLDHIFGKERHGFYRSLFCHAHNVEVSSLVYCHSHHKLADFREMCEGCLLSSAAMASKKHKSLLFSVNVDGPIKANEEDTDNVSSLNTEPASRLCSCCSEPLNLRRLLQDRKIRKTRIDGGIPTRSTQMRRKGLNSATVPQAHDLSHVTYSELNITSESESEMPLSGDDVYSPIYNRVKVIKEETVTRGRGLAVEDLVPERLIHPNPVVDVPDQGTKTPVKEGDSWEKSSAVSKAAAGHGLEEINRRNVDAKAIPVETSERTIEQIPRESAGDTGTNEPTLPARSSPVQHNDSFRNALAKKGILFSPRFSEIVPGMANEDLKLRLSQKSYRVPDSPWNSDIIPSPRLQPQSEDAVSTIELQKNIAKRLCVERNSSNLENFDANLIADIEGETNLDLLKQQIELDRKTMGVLFNELEVERNASTVAANEAMAMINRLQEEKAAMQMEALQYLRMMEEQAEYDQEAIQKLNDLLTDREKELMDMEAELDICRKRFEDEVEEAAKLVETRDVCSASTSSTPRHGKSPGRNKSEKSNLIPPEFSTDDGVTELLLGFEQEEAHISMGLQRLQHKCASKSSSNSTGNGESDPVKDEISRLHERMDAMEADREFLEHAVGALRYGGDGVQLVQEIASQLKELRVPEALK